MVEYRGGSHLGRIHDVVMETQSIIPHPTYNPSLSTNQFVVIPSLINTQVSCYTSHAHTRLSNVCVYMVGGDLVVAMCTPWSKCMQSHPNGYLQCLSTV